MKQIRQQRYEACARDIANKFATWQQGRAWDEPVIIKKINTLSEGYDDFAMQTLDDDYIEEAITDTKLRNMMVDFADVNDLVVSYLERQIHSANKRQVILSSVGAVIEYHPIKNNKY